MRAAAVPYRSFIDGRPRLEGIHAFLASRGIQLPEGRSDDPASAETAHGLARHKSEALARGLHERGVTALAGARRYLETAGHAGLVRAVVSASASTLPMLEQAGLATLVEERVDADVIRVERLNSRPAPDPVVSACRRLGVEPHDAVTFTNSPAGVAAGHAAGVAVVGVGDGARHAHPRRTSRSSSTQPRRRAAGNGAPLGHDEGPCSGESRPFVDARLRGGRRGRACPDARGGDGTARARHE